MIYSIPIRGLALASILVAKAAVAADPELVVRDGAGNKVQYATAKKAIEDAYNANLPIPLLISPVFQVNLSLDKWGKMEIYPGAASTVTTGKELKTDAVHLTDPVTSANEAVNLGPVFHADVTKTVTEVKCTLEIVEDDGIGIDQEELAKKFMTDLKAYTEIPGANVGSTLLKYIPLVPLLVDGIKALIPDTVIRPAPFILTNGAAFVPTVTGLNKQLSGVQIWYVVDVMGYTFSLKTNDPKVDQRIDDVLQQFRVLRRPAL